MQAYLFIAAFIAVLAVIFALQNAVPVTVSFIIWRVESSLALILIVTFIAGLATSFLFNTLTRIKKTRSIATKNEKDIQSKQDSENNDEKAPD